MAFMSVCLMLLVSALTSVLWKGRDTLGSIERLADSLQEEVGPTAMQLREVMSGINQLKGATTQRITAVSHKVEIVTDSVNAAVDKTRKESIALGTGLIAGIKEYLWGKNELSPDKQIGMERGNS